MEENKVQVLLYTSYLHIIGGIETFIFSFIELMSPYYDIGVLCPKLPGDFLFKLSKKVPVFQNDEALECDTLVMIRMMDAIPKNVTYKKSVRMCHAWKADPSWNILPDCDKIIHVSEASKRTFGTDGDVIYNPVIKSSKKAILLVSATRIPAPDKGKNSKRMLELARKLELYSIPFLWFNFSDLPLTDAPKGFVNVGTFQELQPFIAKADYLVQLSDQEGFGYSVAEALANKTAVICTPFDTVKELGVVDGVNGYVVPYDLDFDVHKLLDVPKFDYEYDNSGIIEKWRALFGYTEPKHDYEPKKTRKVRVSKDYFDIVLKENLKQGEILEMEAERAYHLAGDKKRLVRIID